MNLEQVPVWNNEIGTEEINQFQDAIMSRNIMEGSILENFQDIIAKKLDIPYVVGTASGSAALALALMAIDLKPGEEVIVPNITFVATANAAKLLGAKVMIADVQENRPLIDIESVIRMISNKTRAVICVDLNGRIAATRGLWGELQKRGIYLIDDACQAFLSKNREGYAGTVCDLGCFSFGITKTVSTIQGGAVVTRDEKLYKKMMLMKRQGVRDVFLSEEYPLPGFNFKLPDAFAAIGVAQLKKIKQKIEHMKKIRDLYRTAFKDLSNIRWIDEEDDELLWMNDILVESRENFMECLKAHGITSRPIGALLSTAKHFCAFEESERNATRFSKQILYLPSGPKQKLENVQRTISCIKDMVKT